MLVLKVAGAVVLGVIAGFLAGILLSEVVGVLGVVTSGGLPEWMRVFRYVPWALAVLGAVVMPTIVLLRARTA